MKIISFNVNGIRAIEKKGELQKLIVEQKPDVLFIQETKAKPEQLSEALRHPTGYDAHYHSAEKPGYAGTAVFIRHGLFRSAEILRGMPGWNDHEGRVIGIRSGDLIMFGNYFPNGGKSEAAWREKLEFYDHFHKYISELRRQKYRVLFTGDLNVAHQPIDLARPKENENSIGFLPEERAWVDRLLADNWVDVFRKKYPDKVSYTWWQMQSRARERNVGWRIDYFIVDAPLYPLVKEVEHLHNYMGSDHCPIVLVIDLKSIKEYG
ncbi:MAG: exodeoxyribonuclease III [Turneriella sp.]|nr:exodeoxyribonuclease III [Leptospiraceae bacterium]MCX7632438.1 exodeoxyribonuclease III [Turneriella sp.]